MDKALQRPRPGWNGQGENHAGKHEQEVGLQARHW